jgi:hypothetical protein
MIDITSFRDELAALIAKYSAEQYAQEVSASLHAAFMKASEPVALDPDKTFNFDE